MAKVQTPRFRGIRKQRNRRAEETYSNPTFIRCASVKLAPIKGEDIIKADYSFAEINNMRKAYELLTQSGMMKAPKVITDSKLFIQKLVEAYGKLTEKYDEFGMCQYESELDRLRSTSNDDEKDTFVGKQHLPVEAGEICAYELDEVAMHPPEIQAVLLSCLSALKRMGFCTLDQCPAYDYYMQPSYEYKSGKMQRRPSKETILKHIIEENYGSKKEVPKDELKDYEQRAEEVVDYCGYKGFQLPFDKKLLEKYAKHDSDLGEWCRLCLLYLNNKFSITDFQPTEIFEHEDFSPVPIWETHVIVKSIRDGAFAEHECQLNSTWGEAGLLEVCNYEAIKNGKVIRPGKKPEDFGAENWMTVGDDINRLWSFKIHNLSFD